MLQTAISALDSFSTAILTPKSRRGGSGVGCLNSSFSWHRIYLYVKKCCDWRALHCMRDDSRLTLETILLNRHGAQNQIVCVIRLQTRIISFPCAQIYHLSFVWYNHYIVIKLMYIIICYAPLNITASTCDNRHSHGDKAYYPDRFSEARIASCHSLACGCGGMPANDNSSAKRFPLPKNAVDDGLTYYDVIPTLTHTHLNME